jgi:adenosylcobinamide-GDP ribazoletransferase
MNLNLSPLVTDTVRAMGFLTRFPVPARFFDGHDGSLVRASRTFPLAGLAAALPASVFLLISPWLNFPPLVAAAMAVAISIGTTGALHEDGLADIADGFFGGNDVPQRLEIMKDSRLGAYGVLILILSVLLKVGALSAMLAFGGGLAAVALLASEIGSRTALVWHWTELDSARRGGVADVTGKPDEESLSFALLTGIPLAAILAVAGFGLSGAILAALLASIASIAFVRLCRDKIGGFTGDTLGAASQIAGIAVLIALACSI